MIIFTPIQILEKNQIYIPYYVRSCMGLAKNTNMYLSLLSQLPTDLRSEIIISPVPFESRSDLWVLKTSFKEKFGLADSIIAFLTEQNVKILKCSQFTLENNRYVNFEFLIDCQYYKSKYDGDSNKRGQAKRSTLVTLEAKIAAKFIEDILFYNDGKPYVNVKKNFPLVRSKAYIDYRETSLLKKGKIKIEENILALIKKQFVKQDDSFNDKRNETSKPKCAMIADLDSHIIRLYIFFSNSGFSHFKMSIDNNESSISNITKVMKKRNLNILQTNTRLINNSDKIIIDFLVNLRPEKDNEKDDQKLAKFIKSIEKESDLNGFHPKIEFPKPIAKKTRRLRMR